MYRLVQYYDMISRLRHCTIQPHKSTSTTMNKKLLIYTFRAYF